MNIGPPDSSVLTFFFTSPQVSSSLLQYKFHPMSLSISSLFVVDRCVDRLSIFVLHLFAKTAEISIKWMLELGWTWTVIYIDCRLVIIKSDNACELKQQILQLVLEAFLTLNLLLVSLVDDGKVIIRFIKESIWIPHLSSVCETGIYGCCPKSRP